MLKSKVLWLFMMMGALAGWAFSIAGLVKPIENRKLRGVWKSILLCWSLGHPLELLAALPIGRAAGLPAARTVLKTMLFGITWWLPLHLRVFRK